MPGPRERARRCRRARSRTRRRRRPGRDRAGRSRRPRVVRAPPFNHTIIGRRPRLAPRPRRSNRDGLQLRLGPFVVGLGVGDDAAADAQIRAPSRDRERADRDRELGAAAVAVDPPDRAAVHTAADGFEVFDRLHDPRLRRAGDRRGRERRAHEIGEIDPGAQPAGDGAHEVEQAGVGLDREQLRHAHRPVLAHAAEVVAREIDDHHVLGPVLVAQGQRRPVGRGALDRAGLDAAPAVRRRPRRRAGTAPATPRPPRGREACAPKVQQRGVGRGIDPRERVVERDRVGRRARGEPAGHVDLVALARGEQLVHVRARGGVVDAVEARRQRRRHRRRGLGGGRRARRRRPRRPARAEPVPLPSISTSPAS